MVPHMHRAICTTWCPRKYAADWCLRSDLVPDSRLQALDLLTPDTELTCLISTTQDPATTPPSANELEVKAAEEAAEKVAELNAGLPVGHWIVEIERVYVLLFLCLCFVLLLLLFLGGGV